MNSHATTIIRNVEELDSVSLEDTLTGMADPEATTIVNFKAPAQSRRNKRLDRKSCDHASRTASKIFGIWTSPTSFGATIALAVIIIGIW